MTIHGLTVSVGYADFLSQTIARWREGLASLVVVTAPGDDETVAVASGVGASVYVTDAFTRDGAIFNKARAMEEARVAMMPWADWQLFFDADVLPPADWHQRLTHIKSGYLFGCRRFDAAGDIDDCGQPSCANDVPGVGFFQLFHSSDPAVARRDPLLESHWLHGGNYDNAFMDRWRSRGHRVLGVPFRVAHIGEHHNWFGRGQRAAFQAMQAERVSRGGRWDHERIGVSR